MTDIPMREEKYLPKSSIKIENNHSILSAPLWTVEDVAEYLILQPETVRSMARRGELPAIKLGKVWRFDQSAIQNMISSRA